MGRGGQSGPRVTRPSEAGRFMGRHIVGGAGAITTRLQDRRVARWQTRRKLAAAGCGFPAHPRTKQVSHGALTQNQPQKWPRLPCQPIQHPRPGTFDLVSSLATPGLPSLAFEAHLREGRKLAIHECGKVCDLADALARLRVGIKGVVIETAVRS